MIKILHKIITNASVMILLVLISQISHANAMANKITPVERMTFKVRWAFVVAGEATIQFIPDEKLKDVEVNHYLLTARTSKFVDLFYKVRDRIDSYTDTDLTRSILYKESHRGKSKKDVTVTFDWDANTAQYSINGNAIKPITITPDTFDPLSVFFAFRARLSENHNEIRVKLTDGKRCITAVTKIIKRERIRVAGKTYNTILVEPEMEGVGGVFKKTKNARVKIWITDDKLRIPVRFKSKVAVGSFVADLISYERGGSTGHK